MKRLALVALAIAVLAIGGAGVASAHPLGNFTINHYAGVTVRSDSVAVDYVIDMAEIPAFQARVDIDRDGDGALSATELAAYAEARCDDLRSGLGLRIDGQDLALVVGAAAATLPTGQAGLTTLRIECAYQGAVGAQIGDGARRLEIADTNYAERIGWREITVRADGVRIETSLPTESVSRRLTTYPQDLLSSPLDVRRGDVRVTAGGPSAPRPAAPNAAPATDGRPADPLAALIGQDDLSAIGVALALLVAFGLGVVHALSPGHGKSVMAAYLVGTRGTRRQALVLGPVVALSHTAGVLLLGGATLAASRLISPERLYPYLSITAGVIVVGVGLTLVARRLRSRRHGHDHVHGATTAPLGWRLLVALGLSGGIVPSASALLLLLGAIHFDRIALGLVLILTFGSGMAATLVGVGLALVGARRFAQGAVHGHRILGHALRLLPELTAIVVLVLGVGMTAQGLATVF